MRKIILSVLFVLLVSALCFPFDATASNLFSDPVQGVINRPEANIKNGPGLDEKTLCRISEKGTAVKVLGKQDDWFKVKAGPCEGWIQSTFITLEKDVPAPVVKEEPSVVAPEKTVEQGAVEALVLFPSPKQGVLTRKEVDIRKGPDSEEKILCRVYVPTEFVNEKSVNVLGRQGGWYKVKFGSCIGWIQEDSISLDRRTPVPDQKVAASAVAADEAAAALAEQKRREALQKEKEAAERQEALKIEAEKNAAAAKVEQARQEELRKQQKEEERQEALQRRKAEEKRQAESEGMFLFPASKRGVLTRKEVDIRKGPGSEEKTLCRVYVPPEFVNIKSVEVLGRQGEWYKVKFGNCIGWIQENYITLKEEPPAPAKTMMAAAEPAEKPVEAPVEEKAPAAAPEAPGKVAEPRFAESSVLFLPAETGTEVDRRINLRKGPGADETSACQIYIPAAYVKDTWVTVLDKQDDWYQIKMGSCQGWIESEYLALSREEPGPEPKAAPAVADQEKALALQKQRDEQDALKRKAMAEKRLAAAGMLVMFPEPRKGTVVDQKIDIKEGPDATGKTLCRISEKGRTVTVLGRQGDWYKVKMGSCEGWAPAAYLALGEIPPAAEEKMLAAVEAERKAAAAKEEQSRQEELQKQQEEASRQDALRKQNEEQARLEELKMQQEEEARRAALQKEKEAEERREALMRQEEEKKMLAATTAFVLFPEPRKGMLNDKKVNLKEGPGTAEKTLCRLPEKGTPVKVLGKQGGWYKVEVQRCTGWVQATYLDVEALTPEVEKAMVAAAVAEEKIVEPETTAEKEVIQEETIEHGEAVEKPEAKEAVEEKAVAKKEKPSGAALINEIEFTGNTVIDSDALKQLTSSFTGRELTLDEMNSVADLVTITYQENGYILAKAYLPAQDITKGVLTVSVLEGRMGKITVDGNTYYKDRVLTRYFRPQMKLGVAKESFLEKGLLFVKDVPYADSALVLKRGEEPGTVDTVLNVEDRIAFKLGFDYNNFGSPSVSDSRYGTTVEITDPWWGSKLAFRGVSGNDLEDSDLGNVDYFLPLNGYGTTLRVGYLRANYAVGQGLADLHLEGFTRIWGGEISHPLMKTRNKNMTAVLGYARKYTENEILGDVRSIDEENEVSGMLKFDSLDRYLGKNILSLEYYRGHVRPEDRAPLSRQNVQTVNDRFRFNAARIQKVYGNMNLMVRASGQISDDRLLPMDQAVIGGYGTARGHEPSIYLGDSGYTLSGEFMFAPPFIADRMIFGQRIGQMVQFAVFYDHSGVYTNDILGGEERSNYLSGYGGGVRLFYKNIFSFKWDIGIPTQKLPGSRDEINYFQIFINIF